MSSDNCDRVFRDLAIAIDNWNPSYFHATYIKRRPLPSETKDWKNYQYTNQFPPGTLK